jgi:hypothetical protein
MIAQELAEQHAAEQGRCPVCASPWPCRKAEAAEEALRRSMPELAPPPPPPLPVPVVEAAAPKLPVLPVAPTSVGARFPRENRAGRRRRDG